MTGQLFINFVFGTAIGFLIAQWWFYRYEMKLQRMAFNALQATIAELAALAERERNK